MAKMIPAELPVQTKSDAEKRLFHVLRDKLSDHYTVFHSFDLLTKNRFGQFMEGEIDFLIFNPQSGFLVLEAKDGAIRYDGALGLWYQNEKVLKLSPFKQVEAAKYKLGGYFRKYLTRPVTCTFAHAVCFPDVYSEIKHLPSGASADICITGAQIDNIAQIIPSIMASFQTPDDQPPSQSDLYYIQEILMPQFVLGTGLLDRIGQAEQVFLRLTETQCQTLYFINNYHQAIIEGCAGSGKTLMAIKKARELALAGNRVLLLAYNILLGERLAAAVSDLPNVTADNYHHFCLNRLSEAGMAPENVNSTDYYQQQIPEAFAQLIQSNPIKYDAVIVDEGQDFQVEYWLTITEMVKNDEYFYIFYDPDQNLWGVELDFPIKQKPFVLNENCRNTRIIFDQLKPLTRSQMSLSPDAPPGDPVIVSTISNPVERRKKLGKILHDLVVNQEIPRNRIVIIGGHSIEHTCIGTNPHIGNFKIVETIDDSPNTINYHTYMKFKGCESDIVILLDVDLNDKRWANPAAQYTAISRAKHLLYILNV